MDGGQQGGGGGGTLAVEGPGAPAAAVEPEAQCSSLTRVQTSPEGKGADLGHNAEDDVKLQLQRQSEQIEKQQTIIQQQSEQIEKQQAMLEQLLERCIPESGYTNTRVHRYTGIRVHRIRCIPNPCIPGSGTYVRCCCSRIRD